MHDIEEDPEEIIKDEVRKAYDSIASDFALKRKHLWAPTKMFIDEVSPCRLADLGCGTGRALSYALNKGCTVIGLDSSRSQLDETRDRLQKEGADSSRYTLIECDLEEIPLYEGSVDNALMIASLHHLPTRQRRLNALKQAGRITKEGGRVQISVWSWDQDRFRGRYISLLQGKRDKDGLDGPNPGDLLVPWKEKTPVFRFYHLYGPGELEEEIRRSGWVTIRSFFDGRNHWVEAER